MSLMHLSLFLFLFCLSWRVFAASDDSVGAMAANLMEPVVVIANFVNSACIVIGGTFIFSGIIKYMQHRVNPLAVPIGTVVFMFVGGVVLLCLPLAYILSEEGQPPYVQTQSTTENTNKNTNTPQQGS